MSSDSSLVSSLHQRWWPTVHGVIIVTCIEIEPSTNISIIKQSGLSVLFTLEIKQIEWPWSVYFLKIFVTIEITNQ